MPGTIHVAVLEFKGFSSPSKPSAKSLKVSMGKRQYQTWDKGNFSFPITKIRENLVVALLDAGGNEIAHQDIQTMQIIEKGSWDEVFSINGGGHVHMKLQFTLSEEDRNRVRFMRESVMKKKLEMDPNIKLRLEEAVTPASESSETIMNDEQKVSAPAKGLDPTIPKAEASQAGSSPAILDGAIPRSQSAPSYSPGNEEAPSSSKFPRSSMSKQGPVRKMISAFESSQLQGAAVSVPSQLNKVGNDKATADFEDRHMDQLPTTTSGTDSEVLNDEQELELASNERLTKEILKQGEETPLDVMRQSPSETASSSGFNLKTSTMIDIPKTLEHYKQEYQSSAMWIFPDNTRRLCTTIGDEHVMRKVGEAKTHQTNNNSSEMQKNPMHEHEIEKNSKKIRKQPESGSASSPNDSSHGLVGQVIKIALIVGFGVLVLLTRQKEPRKKHKEEKDHIFHTPDY